MTAEDDQHGRLCVEVVRGGASVFGFGATGGVIDIIAERPVEGPPRIDAEAGVRLSLTHPDDSLEYDASAHVSGARGSFDYVLGGSALIRNGRLYADGDRLPADPLGAQGGLADTDTFNLLAKGGFEFGGDQRVELSANWYQLEQDSDFTSNEFSTPPSTR